VHVEDRGSTAGVTGSEAAGEEVGIRHQFLGKGREEADDVERLVDHDTVHQRHVLGRSAAPDEELSAAVALGHHPGSLCR